MDKLHLLTQNNNHTEARIHLSMMLQNKKLRKFYTAMMELRDVFGGYGPELNKLNQIASKKDPIVLICRTGRRTGIVAKFLSEKLGYKSIYDVTDGITDWLKDGNSVVKPIIN